MFTNIPATSAENAECDGGRGRRQAATIAQYTRAFSVLPQNLANILEEELNNKDIYRIPSRKVSVCPDLIARANTQYCGYVQYERIPQIRYCHCERLPRRGGIERSVSGFLAGLVKDKSTRTAQTYQILKKILISFHFFLIGIFSY